MKTKKQFAVNATDNAGGEIPTTKTTRNVSLIPTKDADFLTVAKAIRDKWAANPALTLLWLTQPNYAIMVNNYDLNLAARTTVGSGRQTQTQTLKQVNTSINDAVSNVKLYIQKKFKKNAEPQYSRYGIILENKTYSLPKDNDKRLLALPLMQAAIVADGFDTEEFGTAFWASTITDFKNAFTASSNTTKGISGKVAAKDGDIEKIRKALEAIIHLLQANYPDTIDNTLREWGFIKQNY